MRPLLNVRWSRQGWPQGGSLLWCADHFAFFKDALEAVGANIMVDERLR